MAKVHHTLAEARPTAVDPLNAMRGMLAQMTGDTVAGRQQQALAAAEQFAEDDVAHCKALGQHGEPLIREGARVLTHCNAGWLAFVDVGSATAPMYAAQANGKSFHVFVTRHGRARRAPSSPLGNWRSRASRTTSSPTTPPVI